MASSSSPSPVARKWGIKLKSSPGSNIAPSAETSSDWLGPLLVAAKAGAAVGESFTIPYVKGAFTIVVLLLETVQVE